MFIRDIFWRVLTFSEHKFWPLTFRQTLQWQKSFDRLLSLDDCICLNGGRQLCSIHIHYKEQQLRLHMNLILYRWLRPWLGHHLLLKLSSTGGSFNKIMMHELWVIGHLHLMIWVVSSFRPFVIFNVEDFSSVVRIVPTSNSKRRTGKVSQWCCVVTVGCGCMRFWGSSVITETNHKLWLIIFAPNIPYYIWPYKNT